MYVVVSGIDADLGCVGGSISWLVYAVLVSDTWVGISYMVTLTATCMIYYIKFMERRKARKESIEVNENPHRQITSV